MPVDLFIFLPADPGATIEVMRIQNGVARTISIEEAARADSENCMAILPASVAAHFSRSLPVRSNADAMSAALYAIEDDLAQPVEEVHLALGSRSSGSADRDIYAVDRALLSNFIARLESSGISPRYIAPVQSLLPREPRGTNLAGESILYKDGQFITLDPVMPEALTSAVLPAEMQLSAFTAMTFAELITSQDVRRAANFRTGALAAGGASHRGWRNWRMASVLAGLVFLIGIAGSLLEASNNVRAAARLQADAQSRYAALFPGSPLPVNIEQESRRLLAASGSAETVGFRSMSADLYTALAELPGTQLSEMAFDAGRNHLSASVAYPSPQSDAALRAILEQRGYRMTTDTVSDAEGQLIGQIQMEKAQ